MTIFTNLKIFIWYWMPADHYLTIFKVRVLIWNGVRCQYWADQTSDTTKIFKIAISLSWYGQTDQALQGVCFADEQNVRIELQDTFIPAHYTLLSSYLLCSQPLAVCNGPAETQGVRFNIDRIRINGFCFFGRINIRRVVNKCG